MNSFYLFSILASLILIVLWQTFGKVKSLNKFFGTLLLFALIAYALSLFQLHLKDYYSLKIVFRDLILLGFASLFSVLARRSFITGLAWLVFSGFLIYLLIQNTGILLPKDYKLDPEAELFIKIKEGEEMSAELIDYFNEKGIRWIEAFKPAFAEETEIDNYLVLDIPDQNLWSSCKIKSKLESFDEIELLEENEEINISPIPVELSKNNLKQGSIFNDPLMKDQWALDALNITELNGLIEKEASIAKKASLFILDTGIDAKHEDISVNYKSINKKYDIDKQAHGTHCAGIAAAVTNNKKGVSSLALNNELFTVTGIKVLSDFGTGTQKRIVDGIIEAAENGADVISLSLGGRSTDRRQKLYEETVAYANSLGSIVVVAAGNSNMNAKDYSPANTPGVIAVAAIDENLQLAGFSNTVQDLSMGVCAPGVNILSTVPGNDYKAFNGTSMATPFVAGLVSIMKSMNPDLTTEEAYQLINENGQNIQQSKSGNLIDPYKTIKRLIQK